MVAWSGDCWVAQMAEQRADYSVAWKAGPTAAPTVVRSEQYLAELRVAQRVY
jgi:hypothetical protein